LLTYKKKFHTKFIGITIKWKAKHSSCATAMLFYTLQNLP